MSQYIVTQQRSNSDGEIVIKYFFRSQEKRSDKMWQNWFSVNDQKIVFKNHFVYKASIILNQYIIVHLCPVYKYKYIVKKYSKEDLGLYCYDWRARPLFKISSTEIKKNTNLIAYGYLKKIKVRGSHAVYCYDLNGKKLWEMEKPRFADGKFLKGRKIKQNHCLNTGSSDHYIISKNGHLITYVPSVIDDGRLGTKMESSQNDIHYEIDLKTGKIVAIHEGIDPINLIACQPKNETIAEKEPVNHQKFISNSHPKYRQACTELIENVLLRPGMYFSSLGELEAIMRGHFVAFKQLKLISSDDPFHSCFGDWLYTKTGVSAASGWSHVIELLASAKKENPEEVFSTLVKEFLIHWNTS